MRNVKMTDLVWVSATPVQKTSTGIEEFYSGYFSFQLIDQEIFYIVFPRGKAAAQSA